MILKPEDIDVNKKYRFKTKEEFIEDFGTDFNSKVEYDWNSSGAMDYLFGTSPFTQSDLYKFKDGSKIVKIERKGDLYGTWNISLDMIVEDKQDQHKGCTACEFLDETKVRCTCISKCDSKYSSWKAKENKKEDKIEKTCSNCQYDNISSLQPPCDVCVLDFSNFKPKDTSDEKEQSSLNSKDLTFEDLKIGYYYRFKKEVNYQTSKSSTYGVGWHKLQSFLYKDSYKLVNGRKYSSDAGYLSFNINGSNWSILLEISELEEDVGKFKQEHQLKVVKPASIPINRVHSCENEQKVFDKNLIKTDINFSKIFEDQDRTVKLDGRLG